MKKLVFDKPMTFRLTPGSNDYTSPNTNPTRPSQHLTWPRGRSPVGHYLGSSPGGNHRGEFTCFSIIYICSFGLNLQVILLWLKSLREQLFRATTASTFVRDGETGEDPASNDLRRELEKW